MSDYKLTNKLINIKDHSYKVYEKTESDGFTYVYPADITDHWPDPNVIRYISVLPGVGKTYWSIETMSLGAVEEKYIYLYVAPTKELLKEVEGKLIIRKKERLKEASKKKSDRKIKVVVQTGNSYSGLSVADNFINKLSNAKGGDVFLITHSLYLNMPDEIKNKDKIIAIFDEAQLIGLTNIPLKPTEQDLVSLKKHIKLEPIRNFNRTKEIKGDFNEEDIEEYFKVHGSPSLIKEYKYAGDSVYNKRYYKFLKSTTNKKLNVFLIRNTTQYSLFSFTSPKHSFEGFKKVYLMGAFFEYSELYHVLKKDSHVLKDVSEVAMGNIIPIKKRFAKLQITPLVKISSAYEGDSYLSKNVVQNCLVLPSKSKRTAKIIQDFYDQYENVGEIFKKKGQTKKLNILKDAFCMREDRLKLDKDLYNKLMKLTQGLRDKYSDEVQDVFQYLLDLALKNTPKQNQILVIANSSNKEYPYCKRIKPEYFVTQSIHGLNKYAHMDTLYFLTALQPSPLLKSFYSHFIPSYKWEYNLIASNIIQALCRLNIRNKNVKLPTHLYVATQKTANLVHEVLNDVLGINIVDSNPVINNSFALMEFRNNISLKSAEPKKVKNHLIGENNEKLTTHTVLRQDKKYKELDSQRNTLNKQISRLEKNSTLYIELVNQKVELLKKIKNRRLKIQEKKGLKDYKPRKT